MVGGLVQCIEIDRGTMADDTGGVCVPLLNPSPPHPAVSSIVVFTRNPTVEKRVFPLILSNSQQSF